MASLRLSHSFPGQKHRTRVALSLPLPRAECARGSLGGRREGKAAGAGIPPHTSRSDLPRGPSVLLS